MVTVIIPTASRAVLLREALQSVAQQTAVKSIDRVYVSENGMNRESETVCAEFPQLPIIYVFRDPTFSALYHAKVMMSEFLQGDFTCILHDDDSWLPHHLENALFAFKENPDASVYGSNFHINIDGDIGGFNDLVPWFGANYAPPSPYWKISRSNILLGSLMGLVVHYSTMVARTAALKEAAYVYDEDNTFDNDRMVLGALSAFGPVLFGTQVSAIIRHHNKRETSLFTQREQALRMAKTSAWLITCSNKTWPVVASILLKRLSECPDPGSKTELLQIANERPWCLPEIVQHLDPITDKSILLQIEKFKIRF